MIGQHSELFAFPEINLILADDFQSYIALMKKQILNLKDGDLRSIAYIFFGDQSFDSIKKASDFLIQNPQIKTNDVFKSFQEKVHPKRLITKSPLYASDLSYLKRLPTDTFFIHLLRNPLTQNRSLENYLRLLDLNPSNHLYLAHSENRYKGWINEQQNIETFLQEIPNNRKIRIYSEFIMREPKEAMKGLCHFLNVSDDEENIEQMLHPEKSIFASVGNDTARFGNDPKFLMHPKLRVPNESINDSIDKCPLEVKNIIKAYHYDYYI
jgi:Sulfotransferase family